MNDILSFQQGNAKLGKSIITFSLPSGFSCPGAIECLSKADKETGKLQDGAFTKFRCFSASQENLYPNVRKNRWNNFEAVKHFLKSGTLAEEITKQLPKNPLIVRIHVGGDFFSQAYFDAWLKAAKMNPNTIFYAYTKSINFWVNRLGSIPKNFMLTASFGGKYDEMISEFNLKFAKVVFSVKEAENRGLEIDHDDTHAYRGTKSFALLIHGKQKAKSPASQAISALAKQGIFGYGSKKNVAMNVRGNGVAELAK